MVGYPESGIPTALRCRYGVWRIGTIPTAALRIRISDRRLLREVLDLFRRAECIAEQASADSIEVYVPRAPSPDQARREVEVYLSTWQARHPEATAELLD
jgi:hypothetical protein